MKKVIFSLLLLTLLVGCANNAITGRKQLSLVPESELQAMAINQYAQFLSTNRALPAANTQAAMVKRIGNKIANAITSYYQSKGMGNLLDGYKWEFNLVDNKEINAWCMPGGKVVVYTGILPVTQNENALAVVMGHEIAHAVAGHGRERVSQQMVAQGVQVIGSAALSRNPQMNNIFSQVYPVGSQVGVLLPNSRKQELEADRFGLLFAAMAGYNPQEAIPFWQRMSQAGGNKPPEFMSSHPSDQMRIDKLRESMPEAMNYYQKAVK
ncbi:MAG: M48 family metallopeptidase [Chitinophagaceae bacterium]